MASLVEITPVLRQISCDEYGRAKLLFTVTNIHGAAIRFSSRIIGGEGIRPEHFEFVGGSERTLAPHATVQLLIEVYLPSRLSVGRYRLKLEVSDGSRSPPRTDVSPTVLLEVPHALTADPSRIEVDANAETEAPKRRPSLWARLFVLLFGWLGPIGDLIGNWFWGGQPVGARTVDPSIVKKALLLIAIVFFVGTISAAVPPANYSVSKNGRTVTCDLEADHESDACRAFMESSVVYSLLGWLGGLVPEPDIEFKNVCDLMCKSEDG